MKKHGMWAGAAAILLTMAATPALADDLAGEGLLAAGALMQGDYAQAMRQLRAVPPRAMEDSARLINLGNAYAGLGRVADARVAYHAAERAPEMELALADGTEGSSREVARRALARLPQAYAMR
ncbi:MAG: tetratricopeptide repeat protein [Sphingobium sp.]